MSNSIAFFHSIGYEAVFTPQELAAFEVGLSQAKIWAMQAEYRIRCEKLTKDLGLQVKSHKAQSITVDGVAIYVIPLSAIEAAYCADGQFAKTAQEQAACDGMVTRTIKALNAHVYCAEKENFSEYKGAQEAAKLGKRFVLVENLS